MSIIGGIPAPRIVIKKTGHADYDFRLQRFKDYKPIYTPEFIRHELQSGLILTKQRKLSYAAEIFYEGVDGAELANLSRLYHQMDYTDEPGYDEVRIYPYVVDDPDFYIPVTISDDDMELNYWRMLVHKDFTLKLVGTGPVTQAPLALPSYLMLMRNIWSITEHGAIVDFPGLMTSAGYWVDCRALDGDWLSINERRRNGFTAAGPLNGGIARYLVVDESLDTLPGSLVRVKSATLGTSNTAVAFSSALPTANPFLDVRSLDGTEITLVSFDKNGFVARAAEAGTEVMYLAVDRTLTAFQQSTIKVIDVACPTQTTVVTLDTPMRNEYYWVSPKSTTGTSHVKVLSQTQNGFTLRHYDEHSITVRCFMLSQEEW